MFRRDILQELKKWAAKSNRKPLVLRGARQVGKTTAIGMFSKDFDQYINLNLEKASDREIFEKEYPLLICLLHCSYLQVKSVPEEEPLFLLMKFRTLQKL
jgi:predicted AAA+ superfamily ATPase